MTLQHFMKQAISPWMREDGPDNDIVLSSRIRLARNCAEASFPLTADRENLEKIRRLLKQECEHQCYEDEEDLELVSISALTPSATRVLAAQHLSSPHLAKHAQTAAALISKNEQVSMMVNEEDHIRMQLYFPGLQLSTALEKAFELDDWIEEKVNYAFDETKGYLTTCPTNVGT